jgi:hypothetical protein
MELDGASSGPSFLLYLVYANGAISITEFRDSTILPLAAGTSGIEISTNVSSVR